MTDSNLHNSDTPADNDLENIADIEKYFLHGKGEIVQKLRMLAKSKSSITGYFNQGSDFFLTGIVDVLRDKNILVLDISNDQSLNKKITSTSHIVFKTKHMGITAQFNTQSIQTAKFKGQQYFACAIPDELLWVQRREHYRVHIPMANNAVCQLKNDEGNLEEFRIIDVSGGGIAIADENFHLKVEAGEEFLNADIIFTKELSTTTNLTIQNTLPLNFNAADSGQRIGCKFATLRVDFEAELQKYINQLDSENRKTLPDN